jgi:iron complex outermembrane receptor protein
VDFYNQPYKPQRAKQVEFGARYQPDNRRLSLSAALFDLRDTNRKVPDPQNPSNSLQVGEARVRGLEFESHYRAWANVEVVGTYTYTDARIWKSTGADLGKRLPTMPKHMSTLWAMRMFSIGGVRGFTAGAGARYTGSSYDGTDKLRTPVVTLYDATFAYDPGKWRFAVNAANLADKSYVSTCLARGDCFYGMRRTIVASVAYRF